MVMDGIEGINAEDIETLCKRLCKHAVCSRRRRGDIVLCARGLGREQHYLPPLLKKGDVCVATKFYSTGHSTLDANIEPDKMQGCPYRKQ